MKKYKVTFTSGTGVKNQNTFDKEKEMLNFVKMAFKFGINSLNVEQITITEK